jgi:hypothetical protein
MMEQAIQTEDMIHLLNLGEAVSIFIIKTNLGRRK